MPNLRWGRALLLVLPFFFIAEEAPAQRDARMKTVVLGLAARRGVDEGLALAMTDVVQGVIASDTTRLVLGREDIRRVLSFEEERAMLGCDTASCLTEIASALDVDRMVTGSIDKVGSTYFVVISEIDARTVEPVSRAQGRLPLDEDELLMGVHSLAVEFLQQSGRAPVRMDGTGGSLFVSAEPAGARVFVAGEERGVTPLRLDGLPPGTHKVTVAALGFAPVDLEVPVFKAEITEVKGRLGDRGQPTAAEIQAYADDSFWNTVGGWSKVGGGSGCCLTGIGCGLGVLWVSGLGNFTGGEILGTVSVCGGIPLLAGLGLCGWGVFDLMNPPEDPVTSSTATHRLTVAPPPGAGEIENIELKAIGDNEMRH